MTWESLYLCCFLIGFFLSLVSFVAGAGHGHFHLHLGQGGAHGGGVRGSQNSILNLGTISAFLAWFGGTGYLLSRYSSMWAVIALIIALGSGLVGAAFVFWFLFKVLLKHEKDLDPADYDMIGVLGRVSSSVRAGGTGEMIFQRDGARNVSAVRSENGQAIAKGVEVVVTRYDRGIAYVRPWDEVSETRSSDVSNVKEN